MSQKDIETILPKYSHVIIIIFMIVQFSAHLIFLSRGTEYITTYLTIDDTYYYLETAWNHHILGYPSFDGIHSINGFHFLWYIILLGTSYIIPVKHDLLPVAIALCALLNTLSYIFIIKIGVKQKSTIFSIILASLWFLTNITPFQNTDGMEYSLHLFISWWVLYEVFYFFYGLNRSEQVNVIRLSIALILFAYSRIDSGLISAVIFILCTLDLIYRSGGLKSYLQKYNKQVSLSILIIISAIIIYFSLYYYWGQTIFPLTGLIKSSGFALHNYPSSMFDKISEIYRLSLPRLNLLFYIGPGLVFLMVFFTFFKQKYLAQIDSNALLRTHTVLFFGAVSYLAFLWLSPHIIPRYWYFAPVKIMWIFMIGSFIYLLISILFNKNLKVLAWIILLGVTLACLTRGIQYYIRSSTSPPSTTTQDLYRTRYNLALWISENIPDGVLASYNAGQLGYFSNHSVINLDGLVNDKIYFERILKGNDSLSNYLRKNNVKYLIDYDDYTIDNFTNRLPAIYTSPPFSSDDDLAFKIWDLRSLPPEADIGFLHQNN